MSFTYLVEYYGRLHLVHLFALVRAFLPSTSRAATRIGCFSVPKAPPIWLEATTAIPSCPVHPFFEALVVIVNVIFCVVVVIGALISMLADSSCRGKVQIASSDDRCRSCSFARKFGPAEAAFDPVWTFCGWLRRPLPKALRVKGVPARMFAERQTFLFSRR